VANGRKKGSRGSSGPGKTFYVILGVVVVAGIIALLALRGSSGGQEQAARPVSMAALDAPADSTAGIVVGSADAPVTFQEFADYTCPHCAEFTSLTGRALRQNYVQTGKVRWILYDFPLSEKTNAIPAALAARCAGAQGDYWPMHDLLFGNQLQWVMSGNPESHFETYAKQAGVDVGQWKKCYADQTYLPKIMASRNYGLKLNVNSTPTLFIDGHEVPPTDHDYASLEKLFQQAAGAGAAGQQ